MLLRKLSLKVEAVVLDQREILGKIDELFDLCFRDLSAVWGVVSVLRTPEATGLRGGVASGSGKDPALS
jgi:hypothetical protein